jgi:predicted HicB family RNase H-like nuclease
MEQGKSPVKPKHHKSLNVHIPAELNRRLNIHCAQKEITKAQFVIAAIEEKLSREGASQSIPNQG